MRLKMTLKAEPDGVGSFAYPDFQGIFSDTNDHLRLQLIFS